MLKLFHFRRTGPEMTRFYHKSCKIKFDSGQMILKSGELARLADSSVTAQFNDTNLLCTVVTKPKKDSTFLPLTVDYLHKASALGRIPQTYLRRDTSASNYEVLVSRMIDRSLRPLFPANSWNNEVQLVCSLLSFSGQDSPDVLCINAASYALHNSEIPWNGPIGCVRIGELDGKFVVNPNKKQLENSKLNIVVSVACNKNVVMLEAWGDNYPQTKFIEALEFGVSEAHKVAQNILKSSSFKTIRSPTTLQDVPAISKSETTDQESTLESQTTEIEIINNAFQSMTYSRLYSTFTDYTLDKKSRDLAINTIRNQVIKYITKDLSLKNYDYQSLSGLFSNFTKKIIKNLCLDESKRVDGRSLTDLRPIKCLTNMYPCLHGSALFQRGQTQVLSTVTFDSIESMYRAETVQDMCSPSITNFNKNFMLHYEFPGYAVNEISRVGGRADRREIGHGALAEKSVYPLMPEEFSFTTRAHCEVLESNGSSSMASVCATSMALMDAGVPIKESVCGVAMGILTRTEIDDNGLEKIIEHKILTDISGFEDYYGDMDFKIAGTINGITAVQADFKISGLPMSIISDVINQSQPARSQILQSMSQAIDQPRTDKKSTQPVTKDLQVPIEKRYRLIGAGGMNLRRIATNTGVTVTTKDETTFTMFAPNSQAMEEADRVIENLLETNREPELQFGAIYNAKIVEVRASGLMITFYPGMKPALLPNSQIDGKKVYHGSASDYKVDQEIQVKYFGRDPVDGKMRISRKALFRTTQAAKDLFSLVPNSK